MIVITEINGMKFPSDPFVSRKAAEEAVLKVIDGQQYEYDEYFDCITVYFASIDVEMKFWFGQDEEDEEER